jgi:thymidylate kinase
MELIVIRGAQNSGKTTTAALVHNRLVENGATVKLLQMKDNILDAGQYTRDFQSVLDIEKKRIVIISEGDDDDTLYEKMEWFENEYRPDIMVVCARTYNRSGSSYRMLTEYYSDAMHEENEFWVEYADSPTKTIEIKLPIVELVTNRIYEIEIQRR